MDAAPPVELFGRIALQRRYVTQAQIDECLRIQARLGGKHNLGSLLVHRGYITEGQMREVLALQQQQQQQQSTAPPAPPPHTPAEQLAAPAPAPRPAAAPAPLPAARAAATAALAPAPRAAATAAPATAPRAAAATTPPSGSAAAPTPPSGSLAAPARAPVTANAVPPAASSRIPALLEAAEKRGASDVHFHPGVPVAMRVGGRLDVSSQAPMEARELEGQLLAVLTPEQRALLVEEQNIDTLLTTPSGLRCRAGFYRSYSGLNATFRLIRRTPPTLAELGLPGQLASFTGYSQGMVLVTGLAGCGKTSTLAALVNLIAEERAEHILCLEDPIEIVHPPKKALINQRQVGRDTESFARALRGALREDPDVIVIGELRDRETIALAVTAAETGHLVLGSMHTPSASRTVARILNAFPPGQQAQVRAMVSESLHGVITQRLVPTVDGGRAAALEVLVVTPAIANLIRDDKLFQVRSAMQTGRAQGMRTLDDSLRDLVLAGRVTAEEARKVAENPLAIPSGAGAPAQATAPAAQRP
ncbi:MAG TPA: PilT/PilU family type 4a pilus ATPase, partial [Myxococcales bacterium]|nr:PilT/PilU family type 4a pilus ATPase [Myxococcales bacterium]